MMPRCTTCALLIKEPFSKFVARFGGIDKADAYEYAAYFDASSSQIMPWGAAYCYGQEPQFGRQVMGELGVKSVPAYDLFGEEHDCRFYQPASGHVAQQAAIQIYHQQKVQMSAPAPNIQFIQNSGILAINSTLTNVTQSLKQNRALEESRRESLVKLFEELKEKLISTPPSHVEPASVVADQAADIYKELERTPPRESMLRIKAEGLVEATKALAEVIPGAISIAQKIAHFFADPSA